MTRTLLTIAAAACVAFAETAAAAGDPAAGREKAVQCQQCHGLDGNSPTPQFPKIGGQHAKYIVQTLRDYKTGVRQEQEDLAAWYASQGGLYTIEFKEF